MSYIMQDCLLSVIFILCRTLDRAESHDLKSQFLLFILLFVFSLFLGGKRKGEKNNQSRDFPKCLSARSEHYPDTKM